ncbi:MULTISPECIES: hypothetical protein [Methylobacterium]|uniref:Uncharacterized protein n=1 Tax=Methylobacterium longum TaxID=767694 RepID=A0ABT8AWF2_9HYPH|nr:MULTISPECIES: hypothetical protein [Methylobacterium]MCJ2098251.1 hypothetical protein [Methylobacterium sp. E-046]MDN3574221.1 hypothetical protein [Methylobacterium longum]GJE11460.1 hypothetical protein FOHLNKBM_2503 [Methylobacterium longum]
MTRVKTWTASRGDIRDPSAADPGAPAGAAGPRWLRLGLAAALGLVAGSMLFATEAQGCGGKRGQVPRR